MNFKIASVNENILVLRQQAYFRNGKSGLPKNDDGRVTVDFVRFKASRMHAEGLVDRGDGDSLFS